ncbi:RNA 2',3'-cyclic phosphodiesterase [Jidongwangia harbinensis]|uniref:RNA 2',3'-cyclic phosphodiesterase n=1 Tax=Jidongwangia harbinensis TaxID=2878561 RepID=UPI001CD98022|nr:RNA 2',3'-cyclic phosphodiesterase [Jidongwangia harbinensis]MCA2214509.1 RNA 2',3'-cyclic phosphodiesterase [Jidongwangia harbinensis]
MRLFVAVFPPEGARAHLRHRLAAAHEHSASEGDTGDTRAGGVRVTARDGVRGAGRRVRPFRLTPMDRWHVTLAFLGEVDPPLLPDVDHAVASVPPRDPITLRIAGGGSFGGRGRSGVLWAGLTGDVPALAEVHAYLRNALVAMGLPHDARPFTPHLTVAYAQDRGVRAALDDYAGPAWAAEEIVLVHSRHAEGGGYEHVRRWPLIR